MATAPQIATRYVKALTQLVSDVKSLEKAEAELQAIASHVKANADLRQAIQNPVIARREKAAVVEALCRKLKVQNMTQKFATMLAENGRLTILDEIITTLQQQLATLRGEAMANVTVAKMMNAKQEDALAKQLSKATGKTVKLTFKENADIIGGLILHMDGKMLDHSIKGKLQRLELALR